MAFWIATAVAMVERSLYWRPTGDLIVLGRTGMSFTRQELATVLKLAGFDRERLDKFCRSGDEAVASEEFFELMGFSSVRFIDIQENEECIFADLNYPIQSDLIGSADAVFDLGTSEHVFNVHQALLNMHDMCRENGMIIHHTPCNNHINHGYYQFSLSFYFDYYKQNNFDILSHELNVFENSAAISQEWLSIPESLTQTHVTGIAQIDPAHLAMQLIAVRKTENSTRGRFPYQKLR